MSLDVDVSEWESQYQNTKPFFIHDYGCHCGDFDDGDDGIIETMLFHSDTESRFRLCLQHGVRLGSIRINELKQRIPGESILGLLP